jgi:hypothetical protein
MPQRDDAHRALGAAVRRLLRPLVRLLLRHSIPFSAFEEFAKQVYVEAAFSDFAIDGKTPTISRASILTGLTRKEVQRLKECPQESQTSAVGYNRAARVLTGWSRDPDFHTDKGRPRPLDVTGSAGFSELVKRYSGDMPARAVLDELLRVGAVRERADGLLIPAVRAYVPLRDNTEMLNILGADVASLIDTIDHNLRHGAVDPRFQRKVLYHSIDVDALPAFRKLSAVQAQALLERLDKWLAIRDKSPSRLPGSSRARVGLGIYYIEERLGGSPSDKGQP